MLTQNGELRPLGIYNWTLPALSATLDDGRRIRTCPAAGVCATFCYARVGTYRFSNVRAAHARNLQMVVDDLPGWQAAMIDELGQRRYRGGKWVRIHDAGDFFNDEYLTAWLDVARAVPDVTFYCYTREVARFRRIVEVPGGRPDNFLYLYSLGGREDHLLDLSTDRHCDVFPSEAAARLAGYTPQSDDDRLCVTLPTNRVAVVANNIRHLQKRQGANTFGGLQADHDRRRDLHHDGDNDGYVEDTMTDDTVTVLRAVAENIESRHLIAGHPRWDDGSWHDNPENPDA